MVFASPVSGAFNLMPYAFLFCALAVVRELVKRITWEKKRKQRKKYYNEDYLKSDEWQRKRYVVLKRDNWKCTFCGDKATEVHHKKYARKNIGKEPIEWLVSVCEHCHEQQHADSKRSQ